MAPKGYHKKCRMSCWRKKNVCALYSVNVLRLKYQSGGKSHYNPFIEFIKCHKHPLERLEVPMGLSEAVIRRKKGNAYMRVMVKEK